MQINLTPKTLRFKKPARTSRGEYTDHRMIIVSITDDKGSRMGVGECAPLPDLSCDRDAYTYLSDVANLLNRALESDSYADFLRPYPALLFALESAMYDYQQNSLFYSTPFALGNAGIPINGLVWMASYDDMLEQVKQKIRQGFRCVKLKIGAIDWEHEIELIRFIRSRFSKDMIELRVDANGAFTPDSAMSHLEELAKYDIHSIEQPIRQCQWDEMARLCSESPLPIALDEELIGLNTVREKCEMLDTIRPQYIVLKPTLHGGFTGTMEWVSEARKRGINSWITSALESNIGLKSVALLSAMIYGPDCSFPQGLGTGQLFVDNIDTGVEIRGSRIWIKN